MPRPSVKTERTEEILDAFERCVARYGVEGATLERIAEEAGLRRSLLRHYIGNRDELIDALTTRFIASSDAQVEALYDALPETKRVTALLDLLFDENYSNNHMALVASALIAAAPSDPALSTQLRDWTHRFIEGLANELQRSFPAAEAAVCFDVAAGLTGIYFNVESLAPLGQMQPLRIASKKAAERLLSTLGNITEPPHL